MKNTVYLYVPDTMTDWEPGFALAELRKGGLFKPGLPPYQACAVAPTAEPVATMGGLKILPDIAVADLTPANAALLILPGADTWFDPKHAPLLEKVPAFLAAGVPVAAICGATIALANTGLLDNRAHTSNDINVLKYFVPRYKGDAFYRNEPAVTDGNLITASGMAPLEFAYQILKKLEVTTPALLDAWYRLYSTRQPQYYFEMMKLIEEQKTAAKA